MLWALRISTSNFKKQTLESLTFFQNFVKISSYSTIIFHWLSIRWSSGKSWPNLNASMISVTKEQVERLKIKAMFFLKWHSKIWLKMSLSYTKQKDPQSLTTAPYTNAEKVVQVHKVIQVVKGCEELVRLYLMFW